VRSKGPGDQTTTLYIVLSFTGKNGRIKSFVIAEWSMALTVTIFNEYVTQKEQPDAMEVYPDGIHPVLVDVVERAGHDTRVALFSDSEHGLTKDVVAETDVLVYWSHARNEEFEDRVVDRVQDAVLDGMGLVMLHSARRSKLFMRLMGTDCNVRGYRDADETERVWVVDPAHPVVDGLESEFIELPESQLVAEPFEIPTPIETPLISWIEGGEVFRSGCTFKRGRGKVFFFGPGHETQPVYHMNEVQTVLQNAVEWAKPIDGPTGPQLGPTESLPPQED
jgi:trehalose utilization protein